LVLLPRLAASTIVATSDVSECGVRGGEFSTNVGISGGGGRRAVLVAASAESKRGGSITVAARSGRVSPALVVSPMDADESDPAPETEPFGRSAGFFNRESSGGIRLILSEPGAFVLFWSLIGALRKQKRRLGCPAELSKSYHQRIAGESFCSPISPIQPIWQVRAGNAFLRLREQGQ
jgi:hypothetical protein